MKRAFHLIGEIVDQKIGFQFDDLIVSKCELGHIYEEVN